MLRILKKLIRHSDYRVEFVYVKMESKTDSIIVVNSTNGPLSGITHCAIYCVESQILIVILLF
ncbi:hypothetical protein A3781_01700 [Bacillus badius]|nr:hypothetical protein A3781_01700 [Bacillus badius]